MVNIVKWNGKNLRHYLDACMLRPELYDPEEELVKLQRKEFGYK